MVCDQCGDLKVTSDLLCKTFLPEQLSKNIKTYLKCQDCFKLEFRKIILKYRLEGPLNDYSSVTRLKERLRETDLSKYINRHSCRFLNNVWSEMWNYYSDRDGYINRYCGGRGFNIKEWTREQIMNLKKPFYIDLNILCYRVYKLQCSKYLTGDELIIMEEVLRKVFL